VIEAQGLTKRYGARTAIEDISFSVAHGEILGFLGPNGAGKTTTLKLLMRLIFPTEGSARILGHDIAEVSMHSRIGYLPENPYFYDYLSALEFLNFCGEIFGFSKSESSTRAKSLLSRVKLEESKWNIYLRKFSKGMLQRVGLAQALINDPEVVFLDEPMSGLDPIGRREVRDLIAELRQEGKTVFMCSHILSDIEVLCDRVAILREGRLAHVGFLDELRQQVTDRNVVEVVVSGTSESRLRPHLPDSNEFQVSSTAAGLRIEVNEEKKVDDVLLALRKVNGKLVSVQPLKQSLEELFLEQK
jgi:ABC-2 type transport system ATP-binding protein